MCPYTMVLMTNKHPNGLPEAEGIIGDEGTSDLSHPSSLPLPQTLVLEVIGVYCPQHLQCHPGWITQTDPDVLDRAGGIEKECT